MSVLRHVGPHEHARVGFIELFFDLVFVFAVTQLSHTLLHDLTPLGALQTGILFLAVWWVWIDTAWVTNWLDPEKWPVRLMLMVMMLAGLVLSTSIPEAFGERGLYFAGAYAFIQIGRSVFAMLALRRESPQNYRNFQRITAWLTIYGALWIAGGFNEGETRLAFWIAAVLLEPIGPIVRFWTPWQGSSSIADWNIDGAHMAERCALFIIIAFGESILVTGATFSELAWSPETVNAFVVAFIGSVAMWWIYFDTGQERGTHSIVSAEYSGRIAREAYTFMHIPIVAGIIVAAVGDELSLAHPTGHMNAGAVAAIAGGPMLYLVGTVFFRRATLRLWSWSHVAGIIAIGLASVRAEEVTPLHLATRVMVILVLVAAAETFIVRRKMQRGRE